MIKRLFKNKDLQIRSGWKIFIVIISMMFIYPIIEIFFYILTLLGIEGVYVFSSSEENSLVLNAIANFLTLGIGVLVIWVLFEGKKIKEIGLTKFKYGYKNFILGFTMGSFAIVSIVTCLMITNSISIKLSDINLKLLISMIIEFMCFMLVGISEEIFFRGYCINVLKQTKNKYFIIIVSSIIFGLMHSMNPNVSFLAVVNIVLAGFMFTLMYVKTDNLWLSIGYHISWNYLQGNIFGFRVSGIDTKSILKTEVYKDSFINGGSFGLEGGLITTIILVLAILFVLYIYRDNKIFENFIKE
ncbi:MAG: type II CAAX endopeptidase family protein [Clostridiales bacterium]